MQVITGGARGHSIVLFVKKYNTNVSVYKYGPKSITFSYQNISDVTISIQFVDRLQEFVI